MRDGDDVYTGEAFEKLKKFLICLGQMVFKNQSDSDLKGEALRGGNYVLIFLLQFLD